MADIALSLLCLNFPTATSTSLLFNVAFQNNQKDWDEIKAMWPR